MDHGRSQRDIEKEARDNAPRSLSRDLDGLESFVAGYHRRIRDTERGVHSSIWPGIWSEGYMAAKS